MKIHFTKKEYRQLLDVVFLGDWLASAHREDDASPYEGIREKIYACAKEFGFEDLFEYDKEAKKHFETGAFEDQGVMELIDRYNEHIRNHQE